MNYDFNVSDIITTAITRHNKAFGDFIDAVKKEINFASYDEESGLKCPPGVTPDSQNIFHNDNGKLERIIIFRQKGNRIATLDIFADKNWKGTIGFEVTYKSKLLERNPAQVDVESFLNRHLPRIQKVFLCEN